MHGSGKVTIGDTTKEIKEGETVLVPRGTKHRVEGGPSGITFLEISEGEFDERDITRFEDKYGRA